MYSLKRVNFNRKGRSQGEKCQAAEFHIEQYYATEKALPIRWCGDGATQSSTAKKFTMSFTPSEKCSSGVDS